MHDDISRFLDIFLDTNRENLTSLENELVEMERSGATQERSELIMRLLHTVKGSCSMFGLTGASSLAHALEDLSTTIIKQNADMRKAADLFFEGADKLRARIEQYAATKSEGPTEEAAFLAHVAQLRDEILLGSATAESLSTALLDAVAAIPDFIRTTFETKRLDEAARRLRLFLGQHAEANGDAGRPAAWLAAAAKIRPLLEAARDKTARDETVQDLFAALQAFFAEVRNSCTPEITELLREADETIVMLRERLMPVDALMQEYFGMVLEDVFSGPAAGAPAGDAVAAESEAEPAVRPEAHAIQKTVRVEETKIDAFLNSVGELIVVAEIYKHLQRQLEMNGLTDVIMRELKSTNTAFYENVFHLQQALMEVRRVSLASIFSLLPRLVRDAAQDAGKDVDLILQGEEAVVDKAFLDRVEACMVQLLRNCVAHGVEAPDVRRTAGKEARGRIVASARNEGNFLVLEVVDDGAGLNIPKIKQKAVDSGMISRERAEGMTDREAAMLIFRSGLSTSDSVNMVSGRGVGLDVVAEEVQTLGGAVNVETESGRGTTVSIRMPLNITLSVIHGIVARIGATSFIIPASAVLESVYPTADMISSIRNQGEVVMLRGQMLRLTRLSRMLGIPGAQEDATKGVVTILARKEDRAAFLFDSLQDMQQVVMKNILGLALPREVTGAALLGDGQIGLVLDLDGLFARD